MKTKVFLIAEKNHEDCKDEREALENEVLINQTSIFGYEGQFYLCTHHTAKTLGIYGIDDWVFKLCAIFFIIFYASHKGSEEEMEKFKNLETWITLASDTYKNYVDSNVPYYEEIKVPIRELIEKLQAYLAQKDLEKIIETVLDGLLLFSQWIYKHPAFSEILSDPHQRKLFKLEFDLIGMLNFFNSAKQANIDDTAFNKMKQEIILSLRNISLSKNIQNIIDENKNSNKSFIFGIGAKHIDPISKSIISPQIEIIRCDGYQDYQSKRTALEKKVITSNVNLSKEKTETSINKEENLPKNSSVKYSLPQTFLPPNNTHEISEDNAKQEENFSHQEESLINNTNPLE